MIGEIVRADTGCGAVILCGRGNIVDFAATAADPLRDLTRFGIIHSPYPFSL
ncbi:MAG: hypothetical protein ABIV42_02650 [Nitrosospira sp.]